MVLCVEVSFSLVGGIARTLGESGRRQGLRLFGGDLGDAE